jgi:hypothetical protein
MRKTISFIALAGLLLAFTGGANAAAPKQVWEDVAGDADNGQGLGASIPAGFDLASGSIARNGKNLDFTVAHHDMPPTGTFPEAFRFLWAFSVNGKSNYRLTVKSVDIGKPDVAAGQTDERVGRADVTGHFRLEGECVQDQSLPVGFVNCPPVAYLEGTWDAATMSFTVSVPMKTIKAKKGSFIAAGGGANAGICSICWVTHYAERSLNATLIDTAAMATTYKIK